MEMKKTIANNHLSDLASKGRYGDTEIARTSKGELLHVNPEEKSLMDMYGMEGERMVDAIGSGTINPETGLEEKFDPITITAGTIMAGAAVVGAGISAFGSYKSGRAGQMQAQAEGRQADIGLEAIEESIANLEKSTARGRDAVMMDYGQSVESESYRTGTETTDLFKGTEKALQQSGLATAGTIEGQSSLAWNRIRDRWSLKGDSLIADLGKKMGAIEGKYESELARLTTERDKLTATKKSAEDREDSWYLGKHIGGMFRKGVDTYKDLGRKISNTDQLINDTKNYIRGN